MPLSPVDAALAQLSASGPGRNQGRTGNIPAQSNGPVINPPHDLTPQRQFAMTKGGPGTPNPNPLLSPDANNFIDNYLITPARRALSDLTGGLGSGSEAISG